MKRVKYSKYIPNLAEELSLDDLMDALADFLLESGFENELGQYYRPGNGTDELDALREAIRDALLNSGAFDEEMREHLQHLSGKLTDFNWQGELDRRFKQMLEAHKSRYRMASQTVTHLNVAGGEDSQDHSRPAIELF